MKKKHIFVGSLIVIILICVITLLINTSGDNSNPTAVVLNTVNGTKNIKTTDTSVRSPHPTAQRLGPEECMQAYQTCRANEEQEQRNCYAAIENSQSTYTQYTPGHDPQETTFHPDSDPSSQCSYNFIIGTALCEVNYGHCLLTAEVITKKTYLDVYVSKYLEIIGVKQSKNN